jgi:hypothetical protein
MNARPPAPGATVEIAHEAIAHHWPRLRGWLALDQAARFANIASAAPFSVNGRANGEPARIRRAHRPRRGRLARTRIPRDQSPGTAGSRTDDPMSPQQPAALGTVEVAHEALIRHWPRLRAWLDEDRANLLLREAISEAAQEWEESGRDESYLAHRGRRLDEAAALAQLPRFALNTQERAYLDAALALREREEQEREAQRQRELAAQRERAELAEQRATEQAAAARGLRRRLAAAVGLGALALLAAAGALLGFRQAGEERGTADRQRIAAVAAAGTAEAERDRADRQAAIAGIRALAAQAPLQHDFGEDERGALLARQAYLFNQRSGDPVPNHVDGALRLTLGEDHFSRILGGHGAPVAAVGFGPDGQALAAGSRDGAVRIWDAADLTAAPRGQPSDEGDVLSIAVSVDEQTLAIGSDDGSVRLRSLTDPAAAPVVLRGHLGDVTALAFDAAGRALLSGGQDTVVQLWDLSDPGAAPTTFSGHTGPIRDVAFAPDGRHVASASSDETVRVWDPSDPDGPVPTLGCDRSGRGPRGSCRSREFRAGRSVQSGRRDVGLGQRRWHAAALEHDRPHGRAHRPARPCG